MPLTPPTYLRIDYDRVCALRAALRHEFVADSRHFKSTGDSFSAYVLDPSSDLLAYVGVRGQHPEHGEIAVFWPRDTTKRDHGFWTLTSEAVA